MDNRPDLLILAGGLGTRLRSVEPIMPKPVVDINGKPFLWYILNNIDKSKFARVFLSISYKADLIKSEMAPYFGSLFDDYILETTLLGTGGAILNFAKRCNSTCFMYLNGDTYIPDIKSFSLNLDSRYAAKLYLTPTMTSGRYDLVQLDSSGNVDLINSKFTGTGYKNTGAGIVNTKALRELDASSLPSSWEKDVLPKLMEKYTINSEIQHGDFIDIGVPQDLVKFRATTHV